MQNGGDRCGKRRGERSLFQGLPEWPGPKPASAAAREKLGSKGPEGSWAR